MILSQCNVLILISLSIAGITQIISESPVVTTAVHLHLKAELDVALKRQKCYSRSPGFRYNPIFLFNFSRVRSFSNVDT